jgi:hypothetical protein
MNEQFCNWSGKGRRSRRHRRALDRAPQSCRAPATKLRSSGNLGHPLTAGALRRTAAGSDDPGQIIACSSADGLSSSRNPSPRCGPPRPFAEIPTIYDIASYDGFREELNPSYGVSCASTVRRPARAVAYGKGTAAASLPSRSCGGPIERSSIVGRRKAPTFHTQMQSGPAERKPQACMIVRSWPLS